MAMKRSAVLFVAMVIGVPSPAHAQKAPEAGYVFPPGGKAGTTIDIQLGGYDWTPDMELFVHDKRVQLIATRAPGPILIPPPPYWFGAKGRIAALPLPREMPAKLMIPADVPPGLIHWQAANANGCTSAGVFIVGSGLEVVEDERRKDVQALPALPVTVSGRLSKNEEVDAYRFTTLRDGPITCELMARRLGSKFLGVLEVRDGSGKIVADAAGTNGADPCLTFAARAGTSYVLHVHDIDFGGDRSYVYRLSVTDGPRVLAAVPAAGRRGESREVELVGFGVATGAARLERVVRTIAFPRTGDHLEYRLQTPFGTSPPVTLLVSDHAEVGADAATRFVGPVGITGVLHERDAPVCHTFHWKKDDAWSLFLQARRIGSPLDVALAILGPDGKELARNDDLPETTDAGLTVTVPADGTYQVVVTDMAGKGGSPVAIYRLVVERATPDFALQVPAQRVSVLVGGKFDLAAKAVRTGGFKGPIAITVSGLPSDVIVPAALVIPPDKADLTIPLQAAKDAGTGAALVTVAGTATIDGKTISHPATAPTTINRAPHNPEENRLSTLAVATTLKPLFKGRPVDQDTGRKVPRGSTFPAEVLVERLDGFQGEIVLQMAATQSYQVQGITGGDVIVPPGVKETLYPCYMPEWLETTRTSRLGMIGVARVADPKGKVRYQLNEITGFVTMTMEGALLKVSTDDRELTVPSGRPFDVHVKVSRLAKLAEPARVELRLPEELASKLTAEPISVPAGKEDVILRITPAAALQGMHTLSIRATVLQQGKYPAVAEAQLQVDFLPSSARSP
jgi:hypothetical protein